MKHESTDLVRDDLAIDDTTAMLFPLEAPLVPAEGLKDARAVWARVPPRPEPAALIYLHGNNNYVTVDKTGKSRVPDWATSPEAREGAQGKPAAPLIYGLDKLDATAGGRRPLVLVPEVATITIRSFWAREPAGQYADPTKLARMVKDCLTHLATLRRPDGKSYLPDRMEPTALRRLCFSGHSGAGLPIEEAAVSELLLPGPGGVPSDLWLLDSTYWSKITGFVQFCERWKAVDRLAGSDPRAARFVCVYKPQTQTEAIADILRGKVARIVGSAPDTLVIDHTPTSYVATVRPALKSMGAVFVRTHLPHDEIPRFFLPALLETSASV